MDPAAIRFTTVDPLAEKYYSWSLYVYVANNPLKYIDPDGMAPWLLDMVGNLYAEKGDNAQTLAQTQGVTYKEAVNQLKDQGYKINKAGITNLKVGDKVYSEKLDGELNDVMKDIAVSTPTDQIKKLDIEK